jgi:hypothetical protein
VWDWRYTQPADKQKYVDKEALRAIPFKTCSTECSTFIRASFSEFEKIAAPYKWIDDLQLYMVTDSSAASRSGCFSICFRTGKFNHFAQFEIIGGKLLPDGKYSGQQSPRATFRLRHGQAIFDDTPGVEVLFHQPVTLHSIVLAQSGRSPERVCRGFREAPSQCCRTGSGTKSARHVCRRLRDPSKKASRNHQKNE